MTTRTVRATADAYGVRVDVTITAADNATEQEWVRALQIATATARAKHAEHTAGA